MPVSRLRRTRPPLRHRPHHRLPRRAHPGIQPEMSMPKTPPTQNLRRLARHTVIRRHRHMDLTARTDLHHPPRQPTPLPDPVQTHRSRGRQRHARHQRQHQARSDDAAPQTNPRHRTAPKPSTTNADTTNPGQPHAPPNATNHHPSKVERRSRRHPSHAIRTEGFAEGRRRWRSTAAAGSPRQSPLRQAIPGSAWSPATPAAHCSPHRRRSTPRSRAPYRC